MKYHPDDYAKFTPAEKERLYHLRNPEKIPSDGEGKAGHLDHPSPRSVPSANMTVTVITTIPVSSIRPVTLTLMPCAPITIRPSARPLNITGPMMHSNAPHPLAVRLVVREKSGMSLT